MTVAEMISELSKYEPDRQIYFEMVEGCGGSGITPYIRVNYEKHTDKLIITT